MTSVLTLGQDLLDRFVEEVENRFPKKTFGYFLAATPGGRPIDYVFFEENVRDAWRDDFVSYGQYFVEHDDAGFVAAPEECWRIGRVVRDAGLHEVGVFHSHQRHPGLLALVDIDFHPSPDLWHMLVVLRNQAYTQVRAFTVTDRRVACELPIEIIPAGGEVGPIERIGQEAFSESIWT